MVRGPDFPTRRELFREAGIVGLGVALGVVPSCSGDAESAQTDDNLGFSGVVLGEPLTKPALAFTDTGGKLFDFAAETRDQLTLLFFGYTTCPDICPVSLFNIATALSKVRGPASRAKVVFVSVDPKRDTPQRIREFLDVRSKDFIGLTAPPAELEPTLSALLLPGVMTPAAEADGSYMVGHPSQTIVFTPDNRAHIMYQFGVSPKDWITDLPRLQKFDWPVTTR